jgi:NADH-quinone oxidoreductase subunit I
MDENKKDTKNTYWKDLKETTQSTAKGLELTWEHFQKSIRSLAQADTKNSVSAKDQSFDEDDNSNLGIVTNLYPHEMMPIPDNGRYKLNNEIDDCIVCNKCAEVCPVNCIEIDAIRGTEQVGTASDGSPIRLYAAKFDIDMAKCCFCGLCTVVCPTECLTMTKEFDFSETDITKMNYEFGNLEKGEIVEKQKEWDDFQAKKESEKAAKKVIKTPVSKPLPKINKSETAQTEEIKNIDDEKSIKKPIIKIKSIVKNKTESRERPTIKIKIKSTTEPSNPQLKPIKIKLPPSKLQSTENQHTQKIVKKEDTSIDNKNIENPSTPIKEQQEVKRVIKIKIPKPNIISQNTENTDLNAKKAIKPVIKIKLPKSKVKDENDNSDTKKDLDKE